MKVLAVHPSPLMYTKIFLRLEPLGIELVAASARRAGHEVRLIDLQVESPAAYSRLVREWAPDAIVISNNYLANVPEVIELAREAKVDPTATSSSSWAVTARRSWPASCWSTRRGRSTACSRGKVRRRWPGCWTRPRAATRAACSRCPAS